MASTKTPMTAAQMQSILDDPASYLANLSYDGPPDSRTREQQIEDMRAHLANLQKTNPESFKGFEGKGEWYIPGIDFTASVREKLSEESYKAFSDAMARVTKALFDPKIFVEIRPEVMAALDGHEDLQKKWDEIFGDGEGLRGMHEYLTGKGKEKLEGTEEAEVKELPVPAVD